MENDIAVEEFMNASARLLESALAEGIKDREAIDGLADMLRAGSMMVMKSTFSPSTGLAFLSIEVAEPSGETHTLMACELRRSALM